MLYTLNTKLVLTAFFRIGSEWDDWQTSLSRFKVLDVLARPGSSYYVQEVRTQFETIQTNVVRTSLV